MQRSTNNSDSYLPQPNPGPSEPLGLIFDCDGTLADTMPLHFISWHRTMSKHGIEFDENRFYSLAGRSTVGIIETLLVEQSLSGDAVAIAAEKEAAFLQVLPQVQPIEPVVEIARRYRQSHPMGVGSGSNRDVVLQVLKHIGLDGFFDAVVGAEDTDNHKPEPDVFLEVARLIKVQPHQCRVYEDADLGIEAARRAGMTWFDVRSVHTPRRIT
jgi:beta-phosphoglucomutase family hydrolase